MSEPLIVLTGATASGKSDVALLLAERIAGEIVSADSMQVYRGMDIGTGKPDAECRRRVAHHLIDVVWPWDGFSAQRFVEEATAAIADIRRRGRVPLVVGGTVLYIRALTEGLFEGPSADWTLRNRLIAEAERHGTPHLHRRLARVDPAAAAAIHVNDLRRIVRALEVHEKTGKPISEQQRQFDRPGVERRRRLFILDRDRADLYARIDRRVDRMMAAGWLEETRQLLAQGLARESAPIEQENPKDVNDRSRPAETPERVLPQGLARESAPIGQENLKDAKDRSRPAKSPEWVLSREASQALGYPELCEHLAGRVPLEETVELIKRHTRQFAKRQMSWFRRFTDATWLPAAADDSPEALAERLASLLRLSHGEA